MYVWHWDDRAPDDTFLSVYLLMVHYYDDPWDFPLEQRRSTAAETEASGFNFAREEPVRRPHTCATIRVCRELLCDKNLVVLGSITEFSRHPPSTLPLSAVMRGGLETSHSRETSTKCRTRAALDRTEKGGWKAFLFFLENSIISYRLYIFLGQNLLQTKTDLAFARIPISCMYTLKQNAIKSK